LGHALKEQGLVAPAESAYRMAIGLSPEDADAHLQLGHALKLQANNTGAFRAYSQAASLDPTLGDAKRELRDAAERAAADGKSGADAQPEVQRGVLDLVMDALEELVRRENNSDSRGLSHFSGLLGGLWERVEQLQAQQQGITEYVRSLRVTTGDDVAPEREMGDATRLVEAVEQLQAGQQGLSEYVRSLPDWSGRLEGIERRIEAIGALPQQTSEALWDSFEQLRAIQLGLSEGALAHGERIRGRFDSMTRRFEKIEGTLGPLIHLRSQYASLAERLVAAEGKIAVLIDLPKQMSAKHEHCLQQIGATVESVAHLLSLPGELEALHLRINDDISSRLEAAEENSKRTVALLERTVALESKVDSAVAVTDGKVGELKSLLLRMNDDISLRVEAGEENARRTVGLMVRTAALESKIGSAAAATDEMAAAIEGHSQTLQQVLAIPAAMTSLEERLAEAASRRDVELLRARGEFLRSELMYEFRAALAGNANTNSFVGRIVNPSKVSNALQQDKLRLNVGCGSISMGDYVNVDRRDLPGVDVVAEAANLPFDDHSIAEIYAAHLLEHFPEETLRRAILPHWWKKLRADGLLRVVVPDSEAMIRDYISGEMPFAELRQVTFGGQDYSGDYHFTMFSTDNLLALLRDSGFQDLDVVAIARKNGMCREFEVVGKRAQ